MYCLYHSPSLLCSFRVTLLQALLESLSLSLSPMRSHSRLPRERPVAQVAAIELRVNIHSHERVQRAAARSGLVSALWCEGVGLSRGLSRAELADSTGWLF